MYRLIFSALLAVMIVAACSTVPAPTTSSVKPDTDKLLKDMGLSTDFWHKSLVNNYKTKDGWDTWFVGADETPRRLEDGECAAKDFTWVVAVNPATGRGTLYSDDSATPNPNIGFIVNDDDSKRSIACDRIDVKDYFLLDDGIQPHQAVVVIQELGNAVECVKQGQMNCGKWKKLELSGYRDDFLKLPGLRIFAVDYDDRDTREKMRIQYELLPVSPDRRPYLHVLDCIVRTLQDGSLELDLAEGDYE